MSWRTAVRFSRTAFVELSFQAIYGFRRGNLLPPQPAETLGRQSRRRVLQSKLLVTVLLGLISLSLVLTLSSGVRDRLAPDLPVGLYVAGTLSAVLVLELAFLWWTGLQVLPTYLSSAILPLFETLPVESSTLDRLALILLLRLFDLPILGCLVMTPLALGIALGSVTAGLLAVPAVLVMVIFAVGLALVTGRFFVRRVQGARGGGGQTILRWTYLVLWAVPAFAMYGFLTFSSTFFRTLTALAANGPVPDLTALSMIFPFPLASLPTLGTVGTGLPSDGGLAGSGWVLLAVAGYLLAAVALTRWVGVSARAMARGGTEVVLGPRAIHTALRPRSAALSILWKDLRTASRTPGYAFLILLPILDAVAVGLFAFVANPSDTDVLNLGAAAVATAALLATFFAPAFFAIEVIGFSYTRTLPLRPGSVVAGKTLLVTLLYLTAALLIVGLTSLRVFAPSVFLLFVLAELPAVVAAASFEMGILFRQAQKVGVPLVNMYTGAWRTTLVSIPGLVLAGLPLFLFTYFRSHTTSGALGLMGLTAAIELVGVLVVLLALSRGPSR
jgi:predicted permease